jgi:type IX secretion system PorP/SprF family membrane protein
MITAAGQSNIRPNDYWDNPYFINPASISNKYAAVISATARQQWLGFPGAPQTYYATGTLYLDNLHTQFGLKAFQDKIGYTYTTSAALSYGYAVTLNDDWRLHLALAGSFQSIYYDMSQVNIASQDDPALYQKLVRTNYFNADMGMELASKWLRIGASSANIFSLFFTQNKNQVNSNFLYAIYRKYNYDQIDFGAGICGIQYKSIYQLECNFTTYFKSPEDNDMFWLGVFYRTRSEMGFLAGVNITPAFSVVYSYDYNVSGISRKSTGSHELTLVYHIFRDPYCHSCY